MTTSKIYRQRWHRFISIIYTLFISAKHRLTWALLWLHVIFHLSWRLDFQNEVFRNTLQLWWINGLVDLINLCEPSVILVGVYWFIHRAKLFKVLWLDKNWLSSNAVSVTPFLIYLIRRRILIESSNLVLVFHLCKFTEIEFNILICLNVSFYFLLHLIRRCLLSKS